MELNRAQNEVSNEVQNWKHETNKWSDKAEPLVIGEVFTFEVGHPVELGHESITIKVLSFINMNYDVDYDVRNCHISINNLFK